jgi:hypothetical protein
VFVYTNKNIKTRNNIFESGPCHAQDPDMLRIRIFLGYSDRNLGQPWKLSIGWTSDITFDYGKTTTLTFKVQTGSGSKSGYDLFLPVQGRTVQKFSIVKTKGGRG